MAEQVSETLAILTLNSTVVFPKEATVLQVHSKRNCAVARGIGEGKHLLLAPVLDKDADALARGDLPAIGVEGRVISLLYAPGGGMRITVEGLHRAAIVEVVREEPFFVARTRAVAEASGNRLENNALIFGILELYDRLDGKDPRYAKGVSHVLKMNLDEPGDFADLAARLGYFPLEAKKKVLEALNVTDRLRRVRDLIRSDLEKAEVASEVHRRTEIRIEKERKEYYLRQQLREIQKELGMCSPATEADAILARAREEGVPEEVLDLLGRETQRLRSIEPASPEYDVIRNYTRWLLDVPWNRSRSQAIDLERIQATLDENHSGLERIKERIVEHLAVRKLTGNGSGTVLCFVGPPGTGKTSLGQAIARAVGRRFVRISLGGVNDEAEIRGHRRTYVGSMPGKIIQAIVQAGCNDPVVMIDEIDKLGRGWRGDPSAALLEVLDPEQNRSFVDHFLGIPFDLSRVMFIATANVLSHLPEPLLDRMEVLRLSGYTEEEKVRIARRHLLSDLLERTGLAANPPRIPRGTWIRIIREYTREAGVRELRRQTEAILRKIATARVMRGRPPSVVRPASLERWLGPPRVVRPEARPRAEVGVATGLAWTPSGGDLLTIEALSMAGTGKLIVTGHLGEVLQESVRAAYSYVRSRAEILEIDPEAFGKSDVHVHFPEGAVAKDGPSAGVTVTLALASLMSRRPVRHDIAMTGEITLQGRILAIGGLKEKALAAHRAGIRTVVLPRANEKDLAEVPGDVRAGIEFLLVDTMDEVLEAGILSVIVPRGKRLHAPLRGSEGTGGDLESSRSR